MRPELDLIRSEYSAWGNHARQRLAIAAGEAATKLCQLRTLAAHATAAGLATPALGWADEAAALEAIGAALAEHAGAPSFLHAGALEAEHDVVGAAIRRGVEEGASAYRARLEAERQEAERRAEEAQQARERDRIAAEQEARRRRSAWEAAEIDREAAESRKWEAYEAEAENYRRWQETSGRSADSPSPQPAA